MDIYLVSGSVERSDYMVDKPKKFVDQRLVYADSLHEAEKKFVTYWESQTVEYDVYYRVFDVNGTESIR